LTSLVLTSAAAAAQTGTLDQDNTAITNVSVNMAFAPFVYAQVVEVGITGALEGFVVRVSGFNTVTPDLPIHLYEWDQLTLTKGALLWTGGVATTNFTFFTNEFIDTSASNIILDSGDFILIEVGDAVADLTGWGLSLNQGWNQASSMFVALYPHDHYQDGIYEPFDRLVFQTWMTDASFGAPYCSSNPNSTGLEATIRAAGTPTVTQNDVTLIAEGLPVGSFSFFLTSQSRGFVMNPLGSQGNLCLGGSIGRYVGPGQIQQAGAGGMVALALDLQQMPTPNGLVAAQVGETWNFQAWHRDAVSGSATSNFTGGIEILFE
jgi:hypothetical protein